MILFRHVLACSILVVTAASGWAADKKAPGSYLAYIGTYTNKGKSEGIYSYRFQPGTGELIKMGLAASTPNPTFLAASPDNRFLYAANETSEFQGQKTGSVSAFSINAATGQLTLLNSVSSRGQGPCYVAVDKTGKCVMVANYGSGSIAAYPVKSDGSLGESSSFIQHKGSGADPQRQRGPHAHYINVSPDNRFAIVCDLGLDEVLVYRLDAAQATLTPNDFPFAKVDPGAGPRHFAFHPNGRFGYVIDEMGSTVTAFSWDSSKGELRNLQVVSTLPKGFSGENSGAEIAVHPNGKFLYGSNRGNNSIAVFTIDSHKGTLKLIDNTSTQGQTPRFFGLGPTARYLFAANQDTDNVVLFKVDPKTGRLAPSGTSISLGSPVCIVFVPTP
ncbi:MAG TPA: lactonase family protein [Bryobacteraceae bacterium]|nr:lactonase family protein [Bryobacteraceae bacterium]